MVESGSRSNGHVEVFHTLHPSDAVKCFNEDRDLAHSRPRWQVTFREPGEIDEHLCNNKKVSSYIYISLSLSHFVFLSLSLSIYIYIYIYTYVCVCVRVCVCVCV